MKDEYQSRLHESGRNLTLIWRFRQLLHKNIKAPLFDHCALGQMRNCLICRYLFSANTHVNLTGQSIGVVHVQGVVHQQD